jgi:hypothetical protein
VGIGAVRAALIVAAVLAFFFALPAASSSPRAHGRELVAQYPLPAEAVARYAASRTGPGREPAPSADSATWVGPLQRVGVGRNPYTLVLTVSGVAREAGEISARWQAGWEVRESPVATREVLIAVAAHHRGSSAAGTPVTLTAASTPLSFRGERQAAPLLSLVNADNLDISDVHLQIWSGSAPLVAWPAMAAPRPALLGVGALCLLMWFFLRRTPPPPTARPSRLPQTDLQALLEQPKSVGRSIEPSPPVPVTTAPTANQSSRVVSALRDVLLKGLAVPTELDKTRRPRSAG